jgi:O-antigen/teichoic acid export membrane protein
MSLMLKNLSRGSFFLTVESLAGVISGLLYSVFVLRWLGPAWFGVLTLALSIVGLASVFTGNFEVYLERHAAEYEARNQHMRLVHVHLWALAVKTLLGFVAGLAISSLLGWIKAQYGPGFENLDLLIFLLLPLVMFDGFSSTGRATLYGLQQYSWIAGLAVLTNTLKLVAVIVLAKTGRGPRSLALMLSGLAILGGLLSTTIAIALAAARARESVARGTDTSPRESAVQILADMFRYCMPLLGARAAFMSGQNLSKVVLGKIFDAQALGLFSFAFQTVERFIGLVYAIPSSLMPSLTQLFARGENERMRRLLDKGFRLVATMACALSFFIFVFAEEITRVIGGERYLGAVGLLRILALVPWVRTAQQPLTMAFYALRRIGMVLQLALLKAATEMGSYFLLIPLVGLAGAAWANLLGALLSFFGGLFLVGRAIPGSNGHRVAVIAKTGVLVAMGAAASLALHGMGLHPGLLFVIKLLVLVPLLIVGIVTFDLVTDDDLSRAEAIELETPWKLAVRNTTLRAMRGVRGVALRLRPRAFATTEGH